MTKLLPVLVAGLIVTMLGTGHVAAAHASVVPTSANVAESETGPPYTLLQMNLCLSGLAGCFGRTEHPKVVDEAIDQIGTHEPNAVTLNEACSGDVERIADETGYHVRFATVIYKGEPLACVRPGGRGVFGNAVLTKEQIATSTDRAFLAQAGSEERRWICVTTARRVNVCTSHLSTRGSDAALAANDGQCAELSNVLASYAAAGPTIFAGDVNRRDSCAAADMWTLTDVAARQAPGIQHSYGTVVDLRSPTLEIEPATYTDHDFMVVRSRWVPRPRGSEGELITSRSAPDAGLGKGRRSPIRRR